ncbi:MAG: trans-aconitate 2-methyltransferase [Vicinamibacterales bacterium]
MPTWNSDVYKQFTDQRTRPAVDLAARVALDAPARVVDLGCGPGNSTAVLARRWPRADLTGIDSSAMMLAAARAAYPAGQWVEADIAAWITDRPLDVVFSNAALQWVTDHARVFPRLLEQVARGGALAVQVPANLDAPPHRAMRNIAQSAAWQNRFTSAPREWHVHPTEFYYDVLAPHARQLDIWTTEYLHLLASVDEVVEWYRGTGLRPWLDALASETDREQFVSDFRSVLTQQFQPRPSGDVLFPFRRLFLVAYR